MQVGFKVYNVTNGSYTIAINTDDLYIDTDGKVCLHTYLFSDSDTRVTDVLSKYNLSLCFRLKAETVGSELEAVAEIKPIAK
jgi:general stress protein 26